MENKCRPDMLISARCLEIKGRTAFPYWKLRDELSIRNRVLQPLIFERRKPFSN